MADGRYDQGQLASAALDFALICDPSHAGIESKSQLEADQKLCYDLAADIIEYSLRDLLSPEGAFYSAEDADSALKEGEEKSEGAFYIWSKQEFDEVVGEDKEVVGWFFGVKVDGNVDPKHDMHGEMTGMVSSLGGFGLMAEYTQYGQVIRVYWTKVQDRGRGSRAESRRCL